MSSDKTKGKLNQAEGTVKEKIGEGTGDPGLAQEGRDEQAKGKAQEGLGHLKEGAERLVDSAKKAT